MSSRLPWASYQDEKIRQCQEQDEGRTVDFRPTAGIVEDSKLTWKGS